MSSSLSDRVVAAFSTLGTPEEWPLEKVLALYRPDIHFIDPFHDFHGHEEFTGMMRRLTSQVSMRFEDISVVGNDSHFCMNWTMFIRLKLGGPEMSVRGITEFRSRDGQFVYQRDAWDSLGMFMGLVPGMTPLFRRASKAMFG